MNFSFFTVMAAVGAVLIVVGGRLRRRARMREREEGGVQIMTVTKDDAESQDSAFDALREGLAALRVMIPGVPSLPSRPIDYEGWLEDVFKRIQMRSERRTLDEQIKMQDRYLTLRRQYLDLMKTTYDTVLKTHDFKRLGDQVSLDDSELKLRRKRIDIQLKELDLRDAELDKQIKEIREGKAKSQEPDEERFRAAFKPAHDIAAVRQIEKELAAKYAHDPDVQKRIKRIADDLCERLMEGRR